MMRALASPPLRSIGLAAAALLLGGCFEYAPGTITNPTSGPMAASDAWLLVHTPSNDLVRLRVDGSARETVVQSPLRLVDGDPRAALQVLSNAETDLLIRRPGAAPRPIPALAGRLGDACLSGDGRFVAAVRHADFERPQAQWRDDDAVYVIEVATLEVRIAPATSERMPTRIRCEAAGAAAWLAVIDGPSARIDLETLTRSAGEIPEEGLRPSLLATPPQRCAASGATLEQRGFGGDEGVEWVGGDGSRRPLITVVGRKRGFHDYQDTIDAFGFTGDCRHVVFVFEGTVHVVDVESTVVKPVIQGGGPALATPP